MKPSTFLARYFLVTALTLVTLSPMAIAAAATPDSKTPVTINVDPSSLSVTYNGKRRGPSVTTTPPNYSVFIVFTGIPPVPVNAGSYPFTASVDTATAAGQTTGTLVINPASGGVTIGNQSHVYTGRPIAATATTTPARQPVGFTYTANGGSPTSTAPTATGSYTVTGTISDADYLGSGTGTLVITPVPPAPVTGLASGFSASGATLHGTVNPKGSDTQVEFEYGTSTAYSTGTTSLVDEGNGSTAVTVAPVGISGLAAGTLYHYRLVAQSAGGTVNGADRTFITLAAPVFALAGGQAYVAASGAQLSFGVNPEGVATTVYFIYSTDQNFGLFSETEPQSIGAGKATVNVMAFLSGLTKNMTYYYEVVTVSAAGMFTSQEGSFTTLAFDTALVTATGTGTYTALGAAAVEEHDGAAFHATLTGAAAASNAGIVANQNEDIALSLVTHTGTTTPGIAGGVFATLSDPVYNNNEDVAFGGTIKTGTGGATAATENGVWASNTGTLNLVAREGSAAPGTTGTFTTFSAVGLSDSAGAIVAGTLATSSAAGVNATNNAGVWEGATSADLALMLRTGEQATSSTATKTIASFKFLPTETYVNGQTRGFGPGTGNLVANATYTDKSTGIVKVLTPTSPVAAETSGDAAAGTGTVTSSTSTATFATFSSPVINDNNNVAFEATLTVGVGDAVKTNAAGIWADDSTSTLQLVARMGETAPGTAAGGTFLAFSDPVYNANEAVAFRATLSGATAATAAGIWCDSTGSLELVAQLGGQAPGCPTEVKFSALTELALDDVGGATGQGGVVFLATLAGTGVTAANNVGIFSVDATGTLQLIVRTGDVLNGKTVTVLSFLPAETGTNAIVAGQGRSLSPSTGDLVYNATFSDKTQAIFNVQFP